MTVHYLRLVTVDGVRIGPDYSELDLFAQEQARVSARHHREEAASEKAFWFDIIAASPQCAEADLMVASVEYGVAMHLQAAEMLERVYTFDQFTKELREEASNLRNEAARGFMQAHKMMSRIMKSAA